MTTLELITSKIEAKSAALPAGVGVVSPDNPFSSEQQADLLISLLQAMYTNHGVTNRRDQLISDIESGACRLWLGFSDSQPVASAALVAQSDGSRELGRAVSQFPGLGGLLMLLAAQNHFENSPHTPLVAEVRVSTEFAGIPSGEATQTICLSHIGLVAHALIPAFGHGSPFRQEQFLLATSKTITESAPLVLPEDFRTTEIINSTTRPLAKNLITDFEVRRVSPHSNSSGWELVQTAPFNIIEPQRETKATLTSTLNESYNCSPFTLVPLEASQANSGRFLDCLNAGLIPCGVDRNLGASGHPIVLFGSLAEKTPLAPIKLLPSIDPEISRSTTTIHSLFKKLVE